MRVAVWCPVCADQRARDLGVTNGYVPMDGIPIVAGELGDEFVTRLSCPKGHKVIYTYGRHKFDVLLESAANAVNAGFLSEAVMSLAGAVERAAEVFIKAQLLERGLDQATVIDAWKSMSKQSERQLGAFAALWVLATGAPFRFDQKLVEFRNRVIHQGYIPATAEVNHHGSKFVNVIADIVDEIKKTPASRFAVYTMERLNSDEAVKTIRLKEEEFANAIHSGAQYPHITMLDCGPQIYRRLTFERLKAEAEERRNHTRGLYLGNRTADFDR